jgi:hypothetical protein
VLVMSEQSDRRYRDCYSTDASDCGDHAAGARKPEAPTPGPTVALGAIQAPQDGLDRWGWQVVWKRIRATNLIHRSITHGRTSAFADVLGWPD